MDQSLPVWSPQRNGLSLSGLELWLIDRVAFEVSYLKNMEAVESWNKNMSYGLLVQAGIEGFIKTRQPRGAAKLIDNTFQKMCREYDDYEEIAWWTGLAQHQVTTWIDMYAADLDKYGVTKSEQQHKMNLTLPSGRSIVLNGYLDGEGADIIMENKCRGEWDEEHIAREIDLNLQVNYYTLLYSATYSKLPTKIWYQHIRRPGGFAYSGPRKKAAESRTEYRGRLVDNINAERDYHFFRYWVRPDTERFERYMRGCLYPMLEAFLDWYEYMTHASRQDEVNKYHWIQPYGLYNPFTEGTQERFRNFRLTGSTLGLRQKVAYR